MTGGKDAGQQYPEWMDLRTLSGYACASEKTLRGWIHSITDPLPASRRGAKIYVQRRVFDTWMQRHAIEKAVEIDRVVEEIVSSITG